MNHTNSYSSASKTYSVNGVVQHHAEAVVVDSNGDHDSYQSTSIYDPKTQSYVNRCVGNPELSHNSQRVHTPKPQLE